MSTELLEGVRGLPATEIHPADDWTRRAPGVIFTHMTKKSGIAVTGVETLRVLAGAVGVADFTVNSLARRTGVSRHTVDTVLRRYQEAFQRLENVPAGGRGRPAARWQLHPAAVDQVVAEVTRLQTTVAAAARPPLAQDTDLVDASLTMAMDSLMRARANEPDEALVLVASARSSLIATGFDSFTDDHTGVGTASDTDFDFDFGGILHAGLHDSAWRARIIGAVADVIEAEAGGIAEQLDAALTRALPIVRDSRSKLSADEWLPLANRTVEAGGTVLAAPVEVIADGQKLLQDLFPHLSEISASKVSVEYEEGRPEDAATAVLADARIARPDSAAVMRPAVMFDVRAGHGTVAPFRKPLSRSAFDSRRITRPVLAEIIDPGPISAKPDAGARFLLANSDLRRGVTRVVNRTAVGLDAGMPEHYLLVKY